MNVNQTLYSTHSPKNLTFLALAFATLGIIFFEVLDFLLGNWLGSEEYSHCVLVPLVIVFLIWQKKEELAKYPFEGSWPGFALAFLGMAMYFIGELSALRILLEYAFLAALMGGVWAVVGPRLFAKIWIPIFFFFFCIPLPSFVLAGLSTKLQLLSSQIGVAFIRLCGISVFLEGNVIDLGSMRLQVVEACSGLNYLLPLMSIALICAYIYQATLWKRAVVFMSSIPLTVIMNSFRIGVIGVLVEYWGKPMAEGFLHDFEGWAVFMACAAILVGEMWVLGKIGGERRPFADIFGITLPDPFPEGTQFRERQLPRPFWAVLAMLLATLGLSQFLQHREEIVPPRADFAEFPMKLGPWTGKRQFIDKEYLDVLKFEDYVLADFTREGGKSPVNFYSAYYASQRKGESIHSPRSCLPGGGWEIQSLRTIELKLGQEAGATLRVNRAMVQKGSERQLVYYWFSQRGRNLTDEYMAKWYLLWDALTRNRSDGALVRIITTIPLYEDAGAAEKRIVEFLEDVRPQLKRFAPD